MTERLWFKIGEAASRVGVTPKELRYWERLIPELKPRRSRGNLRYYHVDEFPRLQRIKEWTDEGFTVADCRELLLTGHLARGLDLGLEEFESTPGPRPARQKGQAPAKTTPASSRPDLTAAIKALRALLKQLASPLPKPRKS